MRAAEGSCSANVSPDQFSRTDARVTPGQAERKDVALTRGPQMPPLLPASAAAPCRATSAPGGRFRAATLTSVLVCEPRAAAAAPRSRPFRAMSRRVTEPTGKTGWDAAPRAAKTPSLASQILAPPQPLGPTAPRGVAPFSSIFRECHINGIARGGRPSRGICESSVHVGVSGSHPSRAEFPVVRGHHRSPPGGHPGCLQLSTAGHMRAQGSDGPGFIPLG